MVFYGVKLCSLVDKYQRFRLTLLWASTACCKYSVAFYLILHVTVLYLY